MSELMPAIEALEGQLRKELDHANETKRSINKLCALAGIAPRYVVTEEAAQGPIRNDQFYGQPLMTCIREYLALRKGSGLGAAPVADIFDALKRGGFKFETKNEENAKAGVRQSLTKNADVFHKLPNGEYGLLEWYPNAKVEKPAEDEKEAPEKPSPTTTAKRKDSSGGGAPKFSWVAEIDKALVAATKPMTPSEIVEAIEARGFEIVSANPAQQVRNYLARNGAAMGWTREGDGWAKLKNKASA
jgi:hypothetical protein